MHFPLRCTLASCLLAISVARADYVKDCEDAGGKIKKYGYQDTQTGCLCPDGSVISTASKERCLEKPRTADEVEELCTQNVFIEPTVGKKGGPARLTARDLSDFAKKKKSGSAKALFDEMANDDEWKGFFTDTVHMAHSESAESEAVDKENPRRFLYRRGLLIANTSHPKHPDLNNFIQVFEADPERGWRPATLTFGKDGLKYDPDPKSCTTCHGKPPRPQWPAYRFWPGVAESMYGRFDRLFGKFGDGLFNAYLNDWNFRILSQRLKRTPGYPTLQYAALGALMECPDLPDFLGNADSKYRQQHERRLGKTYAQIEKEVTAKIDERQADKEKLAKSIGARLDQVTKYGDWRASTGLRYLFEGAGLDVKNFSLDYTPGSKEKNHGYSFNSLGSSESGLWSLACWLLPEILRGEPKALAALGVWHPKGYSEQPDGKYFPPLYKTMCDTLKKKSLAAIDAALSKPHGEKEKSDAREHPK